MRNRLARWSLLTSCTLLACTKPLDGPDPQLTANVVDPALVCVEQITVPITIEGTGLAPAVFEALIEGEHVVLPQIDLLRRADLDGTAVSDAAVRIPDDEAGGHVHWIDSTEMQFDVYPELGLSPGVHDVRVTNPDGSSATMTSALGGVGRPEIDELEPAHLCVAQGARSFEARGRGFLRVGDALPSIAVGTETYVVDTLGGCSDLAVPLAGVQVCSTATVTVPQDDLPLGFHDVVLTNPTPAACASSDPVQLEITAPPDITSVQPLRICSGGGTLVIGGTGFNDRATVTIGGQPAISSQVISSTQINASFGALGLPAGTHSVTVSQDGCSDTFETPVTVVDGIIVFFVDPPVVFNGIDTQVTIFVSGLGAAPSRVVLIDGAGAETDVSSSIVFPRPGRVQVVVPAALAAGSYDVLVTDDTGCEAILPDGLTVTATTTVALASIDPPFGHTGAATAVEIRATDPAPAGFVQFTRTPRAYLSPASGSGVASQLESVAFVDATLLTAIVPDVLPVGTYDLIVVNPTGEVGVLQDAFDVTADPPPEIDSVTPGSLATSTMPQPATIQGRNFRSPTVTFTCRLSTGAIVSPTVTVGATTATSIAITVATSALDNGTICVVTVTNGDGTYAEFSAVVITNPAQAANAISFSPGPMLETGRRAPAAAAGRASRSARFVYAIGGDNGTVAGALDTVEISPVDRFGDLAGWSTLPVRLPAGRTLSRAVTIADRFIYLVGGNVGGNPTASALRAKILDPTERPPVPDLDLTLAETGMDAGTWYYRLSAVVAPGSAQDPGGGEILASDPLVVQIPMLATGQHVRIRLVWNAVAGATQYRLYRTPVVNMASGDERLLAVIATPTTTYTDDGTVTPMGAAPLPLGCTGAWHGIGDLATARAALGLTVAPDPVTAGVHHVFAIAGQGSAGELASVERLTVTVSGGTQTAVPWVAATGLPAASARSWLEALTADRSTASKVGSNVWIYALSGSDGAGTDNSAQAAQVLAGGVLSATWTSLLSVTPVRTAYAAALANNFLFVVGGAGTEATGHKANICGAVSDPGCATSPAPPTIGGWTSLSDIDMQPRARMGKAVQSGSLYLIGGVDAAGAVLRSTDQSVLGGQP